MIKLVNQRFIAGYTIKARVGSKVGSREVPRYGVWRGRYYNEEHLRNFRRGCDAVNWIKARVAEDAKREMLAALKRALPYVGTSFAEDRSAIMRAIRAGEEEVSVAREK